MGTSLDIQTKGEFSIQSLLRALLRGEGARRLDWVSLLLYVKIFVLCLLRSFTFNSCVRFLHLLQHPYANG
jgi:hypothetical protein